MAKGHEIFSVLLSACVASAVFFGCGGGDKKSTTPSDDVVDSSDDDDDDDDGELVPEEKFDEIKNTFERKAITVARCFPDAVDAGEVGQDERIKVSVSVEIQKDGSPADMKILGTSKRSKTLEACVLSSIGRWEFPTLPKPVTYSYSFVLQRL